ncbi:acetyl-CoA carboxylase biotin carboxyl carrier protein subunit [Calditrichota bacterium]
MRKKLSYKDKIVTIDVNSNGDQVTAKINDTSIDCMIANRRAGSYLINLNGKTLKAYAIREKDQIFVQIAGKSFFLNDVTKDDGASFDTGGMGELKVKTPMPGSVIKVLVREGETVKRNQPLIIVEAMKMENEVKSGLDATVLKILVEAGQQVGGNSVLIELAPLEEGDAT